LRVAFVLGFYDPVKAALASIYAERLKDGSIIWIGQKAHGREANLSEFSALYLEKCKAGAERILVLVAQIRGREFVVDAVQGIMQASGSGEKPIPFENAGDRDGVLQCIADFGPDGPTELSCEAIQSKIPKGRILCVSLDRNTSVLDALRRAGFSEVALRTFFEEERIAGARNSGLMEHLAARSKQYSYLLYSFQGLRTLTPEVKGKFERCYEAPTAAKLAELARRWMEGN